MEVSRGWSESPDKTLERAAQFARKAAAKKDTTGLAELIMGNIHLLRGQHEKALAESEKSVTLRPSCPGAYGLKANIMNYSGKPEAAIDLAKLSVRLTPAYSTMYLAILGTAYHHCGREEEAISASQEAINRNPDYMDPRLVRAAACSALGRVEEARSEAREIHRINPRFSLEDFARQQPYKDPAVREKLVGELRKAGLT